MKTIFQKKFESQKDSIRGWIKSANVPLHLSTVSLVVGEAGEIPSVENHLIIGYCEGFTPAELQQQMQERAKTETNPRNKRIAQIFSRLITPTDYTPEEIKLMEKYRTLSDAARVTVRNLVEQMAA